MRTRWLVLAALCAGCSVGTELTASPKDYALYRRVRLAPTVERKLGASWRYLRAEPDGRWVTSVLRWFDPAERRYFARAQDNVARLKMYLDAMPDGPHASAVAERISEIELAYRNQQRHEQRVVGEAEAVENKLVEAAAQRRRLIEGYVAWVRRIASIHSFGQRTAALSGDFIYHWRLEPPDARCADRRCTKTLTETYAIPAAKRLTTHEAIYDVTLLLDAQGTVSEAMISGPELFSRVGEASLLIPVAPGDSAARAEAIARAARITQAAVESAMPASRCAKQPTSPVVVLRQCRGLRFEMIAALEPDQDDRVVVRPVARPAFGD
jgi:hypothetical protein